jgi:hypothetical protein
MQMILDKTERVLYDLQENIQDYSGIIKIFVKVFQIVFFYCNVN